MKLELNKHSDYVIFLSLLPLPPLSLSLPLLLPPALHPSLSLFRYPDGPHFSQVFYVSVLGIISSLVSMAGLWTYVCNSKD